MKVFITRSADGSLVSKFEAADYDDFGHSPDYFDVIAPAFLAPLTAGVPAVNVHYDMGARGWYTERLVPAGHRDGKVVGVRVTDIWSSDDV